MAKYKRVEHGGAGEDRSRNPPFRPGSRVILDERAAHAGAESLAERARVKGEDPGEEPHAPAFRGDSRTFFIWSTRSVSRRFSVRQHLPAPRRDPIVGASTRVVAVAPGRCFRDQPVVHQPGEMTVERCGLHRHLAGRPLADGLHQRVAVVVAVDQRQQDVEGDWLQHGYIRYGYVHI